MIKKTKLSKMLGGLFMLGALTISLSALAINPPVEAANCSFSGNGSDYCYTSNGSNNIKVLKCRPGTTDCSYEMATEQPNIQP